MPIVYGGAQAAAGATFCYHGDFDCGGLHIADHLHRRYGFTPWHFGAADYQAGAGPALKGSMVSAVWDSELGPRMECAGGADHEESTIPDLLMDLAETSPTS